MPLNCRLWRSVRDLLPPATHLPPSPKKVSGHALGQAQFFGHIWSGDGLFLGKEPSTILALAGAGPLAQRLFHFQSTSGPSA